MTATTLLLLSTLLIGFAWVLSKKALDEGGGAHLGLLDCIWFHVVVTWPTIVKGAVGSLIFESNADSLTSFSLILYGPAVLASVTVFFVRLQLRAAIFAPGMALLALLTWSLPQIVASNFGVSAFLPIVLSLCVIFRSARSTSVDFWCHQALLSVFIVCVSVTATALVARDNVIGPCRDDKCPLIGEVLWSPITGNGNFLGLAVAILLPWAIARLRPLALLPAMVGATAFVELSGSRSALGTAVAVVFVVGVTRILKRGSRSGAYALLAVGLSASIITAIFPFDRGFATYRGGLWGRARDLIESHPIAGSGPYLWVRLPDETRFFANYSPHNLWLDLILSGGIIAAAILVVGAILLLKDVPAWDRDVFILALGTLAIAGILEAPVQPSKLGIVPFAHLLPLFLAASCTTYANRSAKKRDGAQYPSIPSNRKY
ncbi:O-antigen ligase family protein [Kocuria rosea]|uniref:O-antigen ligase domain-containing protein n=1 Tax=Kocuria rosea TaxID=1275 RepID=A0A4R5XZQ2_KOCRO|nr:O-antigen ligase family protein [Kocuria rosea]TDL37473.1 O-antigen ligase domain-containing protein [Kocuria rosea]